MEFICELTDEIHNPKRKNMTVKEAYLVALDNLLAATHHLKDMRGKPGEAAALRDMREAQRAFDEIADRA